jgi:hypothetical protein
MPYIDGIRERLGMFIAILLAGCSTSGSLLVDPGHYSVYHCDAMPEKLKGIQKRQQECPISWRERARVGAES